ncbi:histone H3.v1-like isoform X4 [Fundulus heteroclitus]|uniref:histone H3.v1-like isoform X4 n=1 Tax=Fundulus heteroclitus TaxID=8078 RepID=UPI00165AFF0E|nr:histone H3.v1-like isoform X4 [Fundulus heteroclitus]
MFYCSSGGSDPLNMSKSGILRGIITEKLSTAAREILAVVERTVADYEEEASGFRREIERQRRQLELLQPRVKLPRTELELLPDLQSHEEVVVGEEQEEQQLTQSTGVEAAESHNPPGKHSEEEEEDDEGEDGGDDEVEQEDDHYDEDEQEDEESVIKNKMIKEDLKDPDFEIPPRKKRLRPRERKNIWSLTLQLSTLGSWTMKPGSPQALFKMYRVLEKAKCPASQNPNRTNYKMRMKKVTATLTPTVPEIRHQRETRT